MAYACIICLGGYEGASEFWWMRIAADGKREQIMDSKCIPPMTVLKGPGGDMLRTPKREDPRYYRLMEADIGCTLKAKCRPVRSDGAKGEIFTSKGSDE
eukprot:gene34055-41998_t